MLSQILLHPKLTCGGLFHSADGAHHKKPHSPSHPYLRKSYISFYNGLQQNSTSTDHNPVPWHTIAPQGWENLTSIIITGYKSWHLFMKPLKVAFKPCTTTTSCPFTTKFCPCTNGSVVLLLGESTGEPVVSPYTKPIVKTKLFSKLLNSTSNFFGQRTLEFSTP